MEIVKYIYRTYDEDETPPEIPIPDFIVRVRDDRIMLTTINGTPLYDAPLEVWAMHTILAVS